MAATDLSTYDNTWYRPGNALKRLLWHYCHIFIFNNPLLPFSSLKVSALRLFGATVGKGVNIKPGVRVKYPWFLKIGEYCWIGENVWIDNLAQVTIGSHVCISQGAMLLTGNHNYKKSSFDLITSPITLMDGVWVGAQTVVCPGVEMRPHSILTVGSILTKNTETSGIYRGNPAVFEKQRVME